MADLLWPGDHRAGELMSDAAFLAALVDVENAWLSALVDTAVAPASARADLTELINTEDADTIAVSAERDGNPVTALVALLRHRAPDAAARWVHRGLTSQDVVDTALLLCLRDAVSAIGNQLTVQVHSLAGLVETHRDDPMLARTLTQPALPSTAGMKFAGWLSAILDATDTLAALPVMPVQAGGAAGTLAAATELAGSPDAALRLSAQLAQALGLRPAPPWHTCRSVITRYGDALVTCCDAWGHLANDISTGSRSEIGEFSEGTGGGSSTMPHKSNPVLSILLRRNALASPALGAALHAASAASVDERADGGWHAEWATLRTLTRRTVVAASQASDLLAGLHINTARATANMAAAEGIYAEQSAMRELSGRTSAAAYLGACAELVDAVLQRARRYLKEPQ